MHPFKKQAAMVRRVDKIAGKASGGSVGADQSPFSSAGQQDRRGKSGKAVNAPGKAARGDTYAEGGRTSRRLAKKPHATNIAIHIHRPPGGMDAGMGGMGAAPMSGPPPMAPPPGGPPGAPPPGAGGPPGMAPPGMPPGIGGGLPPGLMPHPGMARGGAATGVGRLEASDWAKRHEG